MTKLDGQVAIITGGAQGIGEGASEVFCQAGAKVFIWDVLDGQPTATRIAEQGGEIFFQKVDITQRSQVETAVAEIMARYGRIDILINNAGIIRDKSFLKMTDEEWHSVLNVNLTGAFNTCKVVVPIMREAKYGRIINTSSINGTMGAFGQTNYAATKAGIVGFTKSLARETGKYGITVNAVAPGFIKSEMSDSMPKEVIDAGIAMIPVGRIGTPHDIGHAYLFLASKEAGFVSAFTLHVNGGALAI
jgi:3-oxoacyl-[acyl-carrier protein] reductase|tara:strand:- start:1921 stop:2661 length:741 start_codon:yes stop_codon:yes gene_type:complete